MSAVSRRALRALLVAAGLVAVVALLAACGRRIVVLEESETTGDLVGDVTEVLTSLCARLYGPRFAWRGAAKAVAVATGEQS